MNILFIDDDVVCSEPLLWRLVAEDYKVTYCSSVDEVLDQEGKLRVPKPDCILLDIMMPRGDRYSKQEADAGRETGLILLEDIQREEPDVPVVIITVRQDLIATKLQRKFGETIKEIIVKPVTPSKVIETLKMLFP